MDATSAHAQWTNLPKTLFPERGGEWADVKKFKTTTDDHNCCRHERSPPNITAV